VETTTDASATTGLEATLKTVLPSLERFIRFEDRDLSAIEYARWRAELNEPLPNQGVGATATLERLASTVIPHGVRIGAPGFSGWVNTMPTVVPVVAAFSASIAGAQRAYVHAFNFLEYLALEWLKQLLGISPEFQGVFSSGGSVANLIGVGAARQWVCEQRGWDASRDGILALEKPRIYGSSQLHHVLHRAAAVLGLGRRAVVELPTDDDFRLDVSKFCDQLRRDRALGCTPVAVVATAGTVNTGTIDPIREIAALCAEEQLSIPR
jgi:glutamate/tyrosine decarboxylase-like PLP-dependent enzyme